MGYQQRLNITVHTVVVKRYEPWLYLGQCKKILRFIKTERVWKFRVGTGERKQAVKGNQHPLTIRQLTEIISDRSVFLITSEIGSKQTVLLACGLEFKRFKSWQNLFQFGQQFKGQSLILRNMTVP